MLAFALVDYISFSDPKGLLAEARTTSSATRSRVCHGLVRRPGGGEDVRGHRGQHAGPGAPGHHHGLPAQEPAPWDDDDQSLDQLAANDDGDDDHDEDAATDFAQMFDQDGDDHGMTTKAICPR
jgi:hypothetical protein